MRTKSVFFRPTLALPTLALLAACGTPPVGPMQPSSRPPTEARKPASPPPPPPEDFRKAAPAPDREVAFTPPKIQESTLPNGIRVLLVERHDLPVIAVEISTDRGADQAAPGVGGFVGALLTQGTKKRSSLDFSDAMGRIGARFESRVSFDGGVVSGQALAQNFGELFELLAEAYTRPAFAKADVDRERSRRLTTLAQMNDSPGSLLGVAVVRTLYPEKHPYAAPLIGTEAALKKLTAADLTAFHTASFQPDHTTIAIAGDIGKDQVLREVERVLGTWKGKARPAKEPEAPPADAAGPKVVIFDRPGLTQSSVAVALPGVTRANPDYEAVLVMNGLLGGQFTSRLNLNLREKHAYTYGARSFFDMRHGPGPFTAGGAIVAESTGPAVKEIYAEIRRLREEPVTLDELEATKDNLVGQLPARFESVDATASTLTGLAMYHLPLDEYATRAAKLRSVTIEDLQRVARKYLDPERTRLVLVADAAKVQSQLEPLALGKISVQSPTGGAATPAGAPGAKAAPASAAASSAPAPRAPGAGPVPPTLAPKTPPTPPGKAPPPPPPPVKAPPVKAPRSP
ncbi:M16 family metallopeptidase [Chondromyces apiculatus]|nr:pitrilysin family protein [Chondromyces apiculatus]